MNVFLFIKNCLLSLILFISFSFLARADSIKDLSENPQWVRSLHYKKGLFGFKKGTRVSGFYLSGDANPYQELVANLKDAELNENYQCRFPFRAKLLSRYGLWKSRNVFCPALVNWKSVFDKDQLSLAFASQYMSNPASVFGHTFLIFSPLRLTEKVLPEYLDLTIGYAAQMPPKVGTLKYITYGLGGGFKGKFFDEPLYKRIHEYSNMELRDLWIYSLKVEKTQIDDLLDHLFELGGASYFDYYFLDENCSYMILEVLEVLYPKLNFLREFPFYVMPVETIKTLDRNGLLKKTDLVPSLRTKFLRDFKALNHEEKREVREALKGNLDLLKTKEAYDVVISYSDKNKLEKKGAISFEEQDFYQNLLLKRSRLGPKVEKENELSLLDPVKSHHPFSLGLRAGTSSRGGFQELEFRPAVHDLLDLGHGQIKHSQIRLMTPSLRLGSDGNIRLQRFQFFDLANIVPYHSLDPIYSWTFALLRDHLVDELCFDCTVTRAKIELGASFEVFQGLDFYFLPGLQLEVGNDLQKGQRSGPGGTSGFLFNFSERLKLQTSLSFYYTDELGKFRQGVNRLGLEGSYNLSQSFSWRFSYSEWRTLSKTKENQESSLGMVYFF